MAVLLLVAWLIISLTTAQICPLNGSIYPALIDVNVEYLQAALESSEFTSVTLVNAYIDRIKEVNGTLHMVTELNPDALSIAKELDKERADCKLRGPLHGIPILIKNNIATNDLMNNTAGSFSLLGAKVPRDSTMAEKLRKAGAIILGKANLSQWANFRSSGNGSSNGWSAYGGQTFGAYYPQQDPSGSSSGSAVSSSLGLALASLGSETDGSILSPSEVNNCVGIKPSVGLTSRYLVIPISAHQDTVGPISRSVKDAAYVLQAIAGMDPRDNYTSAIPNGGVLPDYVAACNFSSLRGAKFGVPRNVVEAFSSNTTGPVLEAFEKSLDVIRKAGATVIDANFTALKEYLKSDNETIVLNSEFISGLNTYLTELTYNPLGIYTLEQERNFTVTFPGEDYPSRDVGQWDQALALGYNASDPRHWAAVVADEYLGGPGGVLGALERNSLDAILLPTQFSPPFAAIVGSPVVTVPMGFYPADQPIEMNARGNLVATGPNIPFGFSFMGARFSEASLISYAYAYEQRTMARNMVQPYVVPNTELAAVVNSTT